MLSQLPHELPSHRALKARRSRCCLKAGRLSGAETGFQTCSRPRIASMYIKYSNFALLHAPPMADDQRLSGQGVRFKVREEQRNRGDIPDRRKFPIDRVLEHHLLDDILFGYPEPLRLFGNLL